MAKGISTQREQTAGLRHRVSVAQYGESMYFIDMPPELTGEDQSIFNALLDNNQGVGIIVGAFDETLSIRMISGLAGRLLGYYSPEDFSRGSKPCLCDLLVTDHERDFFRSKLLYPDGELWSYCLNGRADAMVAVRIGNTVAVSPEGERLWYMSVRRLGEFEFDALTGGFNRAGFIHCVNELKRNGAELTDYAILFTNIKDFKAFNDMFGSAAGDSLLMSIYNHFSACPLKPAFCARMESDKFLLLVQRDHLDLGDLPKLLKTSFALGSERHTIESVCGVYYIEDGEMEVAAMIDCAKLAKKYIQDAFVSPYSVFQRTMKNEYRNHTIALSRFGEALEQHEFQVYYQPIMDCKTGRVASAEALVRWQTPENGLIPPGDFIPALEENGNIIRLDRYVYRKVARDLLERVEANRPIVPVSVNLSRMDFFDDERIGLLYERLETDALARKYVHFEITETAHNSLKRAQAEFIRRINDFGGMVYIDDFGVANASIDLLSQYDFSVLKLDMQFVRDMMENSKVHTLVEATISMAHRMNLRVIAEGVETREQADTLRSFGCDYIQGYYYARPMEGERFWAFLEADRAR